MKYALHLLVLLALSLSAVGQIGQNPKLAPGNSLPPGIHRIDKSEIDQLKNQGVAFRMAGPSIEIDYDAADDDITVAAGGVYDRFIWDLNSNYDPNDSSIFALQWAAVRYDSLFDSNTMTGYPRNGTTVDVDSISLLCTHENVTGTTDIVQITVYAWQGPLGLSVNTQDQITNTVLYDTLLLTNTSLSPGASQLAKLTFYPNLHLTYPNNRFVVGVHFYGSTANTFTVLTGYGNRCGGSCVAYPSVFDLNSIYHIIAWSGNVNLSGINSLAYDCNQNSVVGEANLCEEFGIQNLGLSVHARLGLNCDASFSYTNNGSTFIFQNTSSGNDFSQWSFGDGATSSQTNPAHVYNFPGNFDVCLTVFDSAGTCVDSTCTTVTVPSNCSQILTLQPGAAAGKDVLISSAYPTQGFPTNILVRMAAWTTPAIERSLLQFDLSSLPAGAVVTDARLSLYNDSVDTHSTLSGSNSVLIRRITAAWDEATVTWNTQPAWSTANQVVVPQTTSPNQDHTNIDVTELVQDMMTNGNYGFLLRLNNETATRSMTFVSSDYADASHHPKLVLTYCAASACSASFSATHALNVVHFNSLSSGNNLSYSWNFGDGSFSSQQNPSHSYFAAGNYTVCLTVTDSTGCSDSTCNIVPVLISTACTAYFEIANTANPYMFVDSSTGSNLTYQWDFGDGATSTLQNPNHTYSASGVYNVCLTVANGSCVDSFCRQVTVQSCSNFLSLRLDPNGKDAFVWSNNGNTNYPSDPGLRLLAWTFNSVPGAQRSFLEFDLSALPPGAQVTYATLALYYDSINGGATGHSSQSGPNTSVIRRVTSSWSETFITWNNQPGATTVNEVTIPQSTSNTQDYLLNVTSLVQDMVADPTNSHGFLLKLVTESHYRSMHFGSGDHPDVSKRPVLTIVYCFPSAPCDANFTYSTQQNTVSFTDSSTGSNLAYSWDFGDGTLSSQQNPSHTYAASGTYHVCLYVSNGAGCVDSFCQNIIVAPQSCTANFTFTGVQNVYSFTNYSTGSALLYYWNFGDGSVSTAQHPSHTYSAAGTYNACLYISNSFGCRDTLCQSINVSGCNQTLTLQPGASGKDAHLTTLYPGTNFGNRVAMTLTRWTHSGVPATERALLEFDLSTIPPGAQVTNATLSLSYDSIIGNLSNGHSSQSGSNESVVQRVTSAWNESTVTWNTQPTTTPVNAVIIPQSTSPTQDYDLNVTTMVADMIANPSTNFGFLLRLQTEVHYRAMIFASSDNPVASKRPKLVVTYCLPTPSCQASFVASLVAGNAYDFQNTSTGNGLTYQWTFGDGSSSTQHSPVHTYSSSGTYYACLQVTDSSGTCVDSACTLINVAGNTVCDANFSYFAALGVYSFTNLSSGTGLSYFWDFGDGSSSTLFNPTHVYSTGTYTACLMITNTSGCQDIFCKVITVSSSSSCNANFNYNNQGTQYSFFNTSTGNNLNYNWSFGDGTTSTQQDPTHNYAPGSWTACLVITDSLGCTDTTCRAITVTSTQPGCNASFSYSNQQNVYSFQNTSSGNNLTYLWNFGVSGTSTQQNPTHTFAPGSHTVCLRIQDSAQACIDTSCTVITVTGTSVCNANFTYTVAGNVVTFNNTSSNFTSSFWTFGDNSAPSTLQNPTHTYNQNGTYQVCLTIIDTSGCTSNICQNLLISNATQQFYCLSGRVSKGGAANAAYPATVYLIYSDTMIGTLTAVRSTQTDANGDYSFCGLPVGQYLVKAALNQGAPNYSSYVPTYYGNSLFWSFATQLLLTQNLQQIDIWLIAGNNPGGPGFVGGFTNQGANKMPGPGDPVPNIQVMLLDMFDNPVQYMFSDENGKWDFTDVAYGTYKVYAEVLGIPTYPYIVTVGPQSEVHDYVEILIEKLQVISSIETINMNLQAVNIYPNPTDGMLNVEMSFLKDSEIAVSIIDVTGKVVVEEAVHARAGNQAVHFDLSLQQPGVYFVRIAGKDNFKTYKVIKY